MSIKVRQKMWCWRKAKTEPVGRPPKAAGGEGKKPAQNSKMTTRQVGQGGQAME